MSSQIPGNSACECVEGAEMITPLKLENAPGLQALHYRVGTHSSFRESMLRMLSATDSDALKELTTREDNDVSIALIDTWAVVLDILTFYQERIIQEGFIRTATERFSLFELAKHINYRPKPGVAANTWLKFELLTLPGSPTEVHLPAATKVQSIPGQDEMPQIFETNEPLAAKAQWNAMKPQMRKKQTLTKDTTQIYLQGTNTQLQTGDYLLIIESPDDKDKRAIKLVQGVDLNHDDNYTLITWQDKIKADFDNPKIYTFRQRAALFGHNAPDYRNMSEEFKRVFYPNETHPKNEWDAFNIFYKDQDALFTNPESEFETPEIKPGVDTESIYLDALYPKILAGSWIILADSRPPKPYQILQVNLDSKTDFTLSSKITKLKLDSKLPLPLPDQLNSQKTPDYSLRDTLIFVQSEELKLAEEPEFPLVSGQNIDLDGLHPELKKGKVCILSGELKKELKPPKQNSNLPQLPSSLNQPTITSEIVVIQSVSIKDGYTTIQLEKNLKNDYIRNTVSIHANSVKATHGESKTEILGSGNGAQTFQKFKLKQKPLTYTAAANPSGAESTLEVRVNDILWKEVPTLYGRGPQERIFISRNDEDNSSYIQCGDGITGARLPTGAENVRADYRVGIGLDGQLRAGQLSMMLSPLLGIKSVSNPLASSGGDNPESLENIRRNAPLTVMTLDRVVSLKDHEDFANAYAGVGKARADLISRGEDRMVFLTLASADGKKVDETLCASLLESIDAVRHDNYSILIASFKPVYFELEAAILIHPEYIPEKVLTNVNDALRFAYSFELRSFGQGVVPSEVIALIQSIEGVVAVGLNVLRKISDNSSETQQLNPQTTLNHRTLASLIMTNVPQKYRTMYLGRNRGFAYKTPDKTVNTLITPPARRVGDEFRPAELLMIAPNAITISTITE